MNVQWCELVLVITLAGCNDNLIYWINEPEQFKVGENVTLICIQESTAVCDDCTKRWYAHSNMELLAFNEFSSKPGKYYSSVAAEEYSLVIMDIVEEDVNINYTCSIGFSTYTKVLRMEDSKKIVKSDTELNLLYVLLPIAVIVMTVTILVIVMYWRLQCRKEHPNRDQEEKQKKEHNVRYSSLFVQELTRNNKDCDNSLERVQLTTDNHSESTVVAL